MTLWRIARSGPPLGVMLLLLAGCGGNATPPGPVANSSVPEFTTSPPTEGSGPESPQPPAHRVYALPLPTLPLGSGSSTVVADDFPKECIQLSWFGPPSGFPADYAVTIIGVGISRGPLKKIVLAGAPEPCPSGPDCTGFRISAGNDNSCYLGVEWDPGTADGSTGTLSLKGEVNCPDGNSSTCHRYRRAWEAIAATQGGVNTLPVTASPPAPTDTNSAPTSSGSSASDTGSS